MTKKKYNQQIIDAITKTSVFKLTFIFAVVTAIYGAFALVPDTKNFFNTIIIGHTFSYFNILVFSLLAVNTINTCYQFYKNKDYLIRLETKEKVLKELLKISLQMNILLIICFLLIYLMLVNISQFGYYSPTTIFNYNVNTSIYTIFLLLRYYLFAIVFSLINTILYVKLENKVLLIDFLFIIMFALAPNYILQQSSFHIMPWQYFMLNNYGTFSNELMYSFLYLLILEVITLIIYKLALKRNNKIFTCIFRRDISYLIQKHKKILSLIIIISVIIFILKYLENYTGIELYKSTFGLAVDSTKNIIEWATFYFNIISYLFITVFLYIKDYKNNLEQLYLRMDFKDYYLTKTISESVIIFIITFLQHILIIILGLILNRIDLSYDLIKIFMTSYLYILLINHIFMYLYLISSLSTKYKIISLILGLIIIILIPKNIISLTNYIPIILAVLLLIIFITNNLNKKYNKKIIQNIGGV